MQDAVREVRVTTEAGKACAFSRMISMPPPEEIAELYKRRWAIELFFRWVKQVLRITGFLGTSENAVKIQIAVALIAFLLLRLAQAGQKAIASPLRFARLVRANLMHRKPLDRLLDPEPRPISPPLNWCSNGISAKPDSRAQMPPKAWSNFQLYMARRKAHRSDGSK